MHFRKRLRKNINEIQNPSRFIYISCTPQWLPIHFLDINTELKDLSSIILVS